MTNEGNNYMIHSWMVSKYGLSGNYLTCYAHLYAATEGGTKLYTDGYQAISQAINVTVPTAYSVLSKLKLRGLLSYNSVGEIKLIRS